MTFFDDGHYEVNINLSEDKKYSLYLGQHPNINDKMMTVIGGMVYAGDNLTTIFKDGDVEGREIFSDVHLVSAFDQYYATIMYGFDKSTQVVVERDINDNPVSYLEGSQDFAFKGYIGPKEYKTLNAIDPVLVHAIEFGFFTFVASPIFKVLMWLHGIFGNWGWSIIALTALIRMFLYPLTQKGMVSMQKIKEIAPRIKEVQEKYKGDPRAYECRGNGNVQKTRGQSTWRMFAISASNSCILRYLSCIAQCSRASRSTVDSLDNRFVSYGSLLYFTDLDGCNDVLSAKNHTEQFYGSIAREDL